ncbi:MAG TPA: adenosylcobalamin-dependent ribonucleoside-diphosphate reductase [Elusimicrobiota bacterium]|nr:adenosylcobalamin-dependent ribonucleoside-diphosphate reductase [Elusimicrobiota bacterium]
MPPISLTENQKKVIRDKYLRGDAGVEAWLNRVAGNIALAEVLFSGQCDQWGVWNGVNCRITDVPTQAGKSTRLVLFHSGLHSARERGANFFKFLDNLKRVAVEVPDARDRAETWRARFYQMMARFDFLPNSPTLMNAGGELQQLSACYVLPVEDSIEGIANAIKAQALIHKSGGGTGFSFQRLRPSGDEVKTTRGVASGAISFMQVFDKMTDVVKQGGTRRGANMGILPYWHPEIEEFITLKNKAGVMENFNISVAVDDKFMQAVERGEEYDLLNPRTQKPAGRANAKKIFDLMVETAWRTGDPGIIFIDRINSSPSNPTPQFGQIESTNPCGEQPLLPNEPCNLGSVNLANFVKGEWTHGELDWDRLGETVALAVRFLDDVIEVNNYPLAEIEVLAKSNRRIGLGVMGWAETLVKLGLPYDSDDALRLARETMAFINAKALEASEALAKERGAFPHWRESIYDPQGPHFRGRERFPRNCARTTIAPTGTIALAAGLQGSGIEPFFAISYVRYNAQALDRLKNGDKPAEHDVLYEVNPLFREEARRRNFFGLKEEELWKKIDANHRSVRGIAEIPEDVQRLFSSSHDVPVPFHVKIQAAFQEHTDNAVSKTINMPNSATVQEVRESYAQAWRLGCKGITIYRDGSKSQQVLNLGAAGERKQGDPLPVARDTSRGVSSEYYEIRTGNGSLHVHIDYDEHGPYRIFTNLPPLGTDLSGLTAIVGILLSKYLEAGGDPIRILKHLNSVKGDRPFGFGAQRIDSIPHAIAVALRTHLQKTGKLEASEPAAAPKSLELWDHSAALYCPTCYSNNVSRESGCSGVTCHDCGYSECS